MTASSIEWDAQTIKAQEIARSMVVKEEPPNGTDVTKENFGDWAPHIQALYDAYAEGGSKRVKSTAASSEDLTALLSSDPEPTAENSPYRISTGRLCYAKVAGEVTEIIPIADFYARIVEELTTEDGDRIYRLEGVAVRGGPFTVEISANDFADDRRLKATVSAAAGAQDPVRAGMTRHLGPSIQHLTTNSIKRTSRFIRTGWQQSRFLIPGREAAGVEILLADHLPYSFEQVGDLARGRLALAGLLDFNPKHSPVVLSHVLQAPLAGPAGWTNERYGLFIAGQTGSLKTSFAQVVLSLYGSGFMDDTRLIKIGDATNNAIMQIATMASDVPLLIDNYKPTTGGGASAFVNLCHALLEGGEKKRLNRNSELRRTRPVSTWPLFTGEDVPDIDAAALARVLVVNFPRQTGLIPQALTQAQEAARLGDLAAVGLAWVSWLESDEGQSVAKAAGAAYQEQRAKWAAYLRSHRPDMANILRVASNLASNGLTWWVAAHCPAISDVISTYKGAHTAALQAVADDMTGRTTESTEALTFISALRELLASGQATLVAQDQDLNPIGAGWTGIGWHDDSGGAYIPLKIAVRRVRDLVGGYGLGDVSERTLCSQLDDLGYVASKEKSSTTIRKNLGVEGKQTRVLHLRREALEDEGVTL